MPLARVDKTIRLVGHCRDRLEQRGVTEAEVMETIRSCAWKPADEGRSECEKDYPFNSIWNGKWYATKRVRPIFKERESEIVVVTVYSYYF